MRTTAFDKRAEEIAMHFRGLHLSWDRDTQSWLCSLFAPVKGASEPGPRMARLRYDHWSSVTSGLPTTFGHRELPEMRHSVGPTESLFGAEVI